MCVKTLLHFLSTKALRTDIIDLVIGVSLTGFEKIMKYNFQFNLIGWEQKSSLHSM